MGLDGPDYFDPMVVWSYYHMIMRSYDLNFPPDEYVIRGFHSSGSGRYVRPLPPELFVQELSWTIRGTMVLPWGEKGPFPNGSFPLAWWATLDFMSHRAAILAQGGFWCMAPISFLSLVVAPLGASPPKVAFSRHRAMPGFEAPGDEFRLQAPARAGPSSVGRRRNCSIKHRRGQSSIWMADAQTGS